MYMETSDWNYYISSAYEDILMNVSTNKAICLLSVFFIYIYSEGQWGPVFLKHDIFILMTEF